MPKAKMRQFRKRLAQKVIDDLKSQGINKKDLHELDDYEKVKLLASRIVKLHKKEPPEAREPLSIRLINNIISKIIGHPIETEVIVNRLYNANFQKNLKLEEPSYAFKVRKLVERWKESGEIDAIMRKIKEKKKSH